MLLAQLRASPLSGRPLTLLLRRPARYDEGPQVGRSPSVELASQSLKLVSNPNIGIGQGRLAAGRP